MELHDEIPWKNSDILKALVIVFIKYNIYNYSDKSKTEIYIFY